jgi:hypothetical protein
MADNQAVVYVGHGTAEVQDIEYPTLGLKDGPGVNPANVVTGVQLDHTDLAGLTRAAVATEKAGIVKPGATLVQP